MQNDWKVEISGSGRAGGIAYREGNNTILFDWEIGGKPDIVLIISGPEPADWDKANPWATGRRDEITTRVAQEAIRQHAQYCFPDIDPRSGVFYLRKTPTTLVCFALPDEARFFKRTPAAARVRVLIHGMGKQNAEREFLTALTEARPSLVFTCGFAGGLDPKLARGDVVFAPDAFHIPTTILPLRERLFAAGAKEAEIYCADRIAVTAQDKKSLRQHTRAEAVEMESGIIQSICRAQGIPCVTLRVISDVADEDLPLDFNALSNADQSLNFGKLALAILKSPGKIPALMRLGKYSSAAAQRLADVLSAVV